MALAGIDTVYVYADDCERNLRTHGADWQRWGTSELCIQCACAMAHVVCCSKLTKISTGSGSSSSRKLTVKNDCHRTRR